MAGRNRSFSQRLKRLSQNVERVVGNCKAERDNPDLLISDVQMMPLDGIELSRLIRKNQRLPNPNIPIVMMTGFTEKGRIVELRAAGLTEVVAKPISPSMLCRNVVVALRNQGGDASTGIPDDKI